MDEANEQVGHGSGGVGPKQGGWDAGEMGGRWVRWGRGCRRGGKDTGEVDGRWGRQMGGR